MSVYAVFDFFEGMTSLKTLGTSGEVMSELEPKELGGTGYCASAAVAETLKAAIAAQDALEDGCSFAEALAALQVVALPCPPRGAIEGAVFSCVWEGECTLYLGVFSTEEDAIDKVRAMHAKVKEWSEEEEHEEVVDGEGQFSCCDAAWRVKRHVVKSA